MSLIAQARTWFPSVSRPWIKSRISMRWLTLSAVLSVGFWLAVEQMVLATPHPRQSVLVAAANNALAAQQEIARAKARAGLLQNATLDPNRTGLIGPDWSEITTTIGDLPAKRTVTNPDLAAAIARLLMSQRPASGAAVGLVLSG